MWEQAKDLMFYMFVSGFLFGWIGRVLYDAFEAAHASVGGVGGNRGDDMKPAVSDRKGD